ANILVKHLSLLPTSHSPHLSANDPATPQLYTLSLHDALPICVPRRNSNGTNRAAPGPRGAGGSRAHASGSRGGIGRSPGRCLKIDRKSTRLNSSHVKISYAVFCLKKKNKTKRATRAQHNTRPP